jgi:hypothetical protein
VLGTRALNELRISKALSLKIAAVGSECGHAGSPSCGRAGHRDHPLAPPTARSLDFAIGKRLDALRPQDPDMPPIGRKNIAAVTTRPMRNHRDARLEANEQAHPKNVYGMDVTAEQLLEMAEPVAQ